MGGGSSKVRGPDGAILKGPSFPDGVTGRDKVSSTTIWVLFAFGLEVVRKSAMPS